MPVTPDKLKPYLHRFDFQRMFIEELGWNRYKAELLIKVNEQTYQLRAVAEKAGMVAYHCLMPQGATIPESDVLTKVEREVARTNYTNLIIYTNAGQTEQKWQWVRRERGKAAQPHYIRMDKKDSGERLAQRLAGLAVSLAEEERITNPDVARRARAAFDVEKVTKRFYDRFTMEHKVFLQFLTGIPDEEKESRQWYASIMLNRLMFIYFIQKKGFLDGDLDYLGHKLADPNARMNGTSDFYKGFLGPLFFEGFAQKDRDTTTKHLLGDVPYLNGGLFQKHQIEEVHGATINIPDTAFERIFAFFDSYNWHLDDRPLHGDKEINPDVLGYIFEKYINQKQMGAYYTKEDITGYIARNTIISFLFDAAAHECPIAFTMGGPVWRLLAEEPDRYIYEAVQRGVDTNLPPDIAVGVADVNQRERWNSPAPAEIALPTETWREYIARRSRCSALREQLRSGEIHSINDLITNNLDIARFAQDVLIYCEGSDLLTAFYKAIREVTVLDPTCGSGAFLFAALSVLEPLYDSCLTRMEGFLDDQIHAVTPSSPSKYKLFRETLDDAAHHFNERYFILKTIIINNLYGVDIMEEAVEIAKLRLFLKLVAQMERDPSKPNDGIEPLPDIDFNIRSGNTLIGFATLAEAQTAISRKLDFDNIAVRIAEQAAHLSHLAATFRAQQITFDGTVNLQDKQALRDLLNALNTDLDIYLAAECGIAASDFKDPAAYNAELTDWHYHHRPFHWFVEFYTIMDGGGFDVIIGNPPYLELREVDYTLRDFQSLDSGAIHAMCIERSLQLLCRQGSMSMIVPMSIVSTQRMVIVQKLLEKHHNVWYSNYSWRPGKLFDTVNRALTIFVITPMDSTQVFSTNYQKWSSDTRDLLIQDLNYVPLPNGRSSLWAPKLGQNLEILLLAKYLKIKTVLLHLIGRTDHRVYYRTTGGLYWKVFTDFAPAFTLNGKFGHSTRETSFSLIDGKAVAPIIAILSSDLFWWWYTVTTNCRDLNPSDIQNFPVPQSALEDIDIAQLGRSYLEDLKRNSTMMERNQKRTGLTKTQSFKIQKSKHIIDEIDRMLAQHYGLTDEELDFIINYDIKYRLGRDNEVGEEA